MEIGRREVIGSGLGLSLLGARSAVSQHPQSGEAGSSGRPVGAVNRDARVPVRSGKISKLFKSPEGYPNALAVASEGWWIAEQKSNNACLVDRNGRLLKTVKTGAKNTSGIAFGAGYVLMGANAEPNGIFQTDLNSTTISQRQIPLGGGGTHGMEYVDGKLWIAALRIRGILRLDSKTWEPEFLIPYSVPRAHGIAWDNGAIWMVFGDDGGSGLIRYDTATGRAVEIVRFGEPYPDPHGLALHEGTLYTCDAGLHPGWPENKSTASGYICRIEIA